MAIGCQEEKIKFLAGRTDRGCGVGPRKGGGWRQESDSTRRTTVSVNRL